MKNREMKNWKYLGFLSLYNEKCRNPYTNIAFPGLRTWYLTFIFEAIFVMQFYFLNFFINIFHRAVIADLIYFIFSKNQGNKKLF